MEEENSDLDCVVIPSSGIFYRKPDVFVYGEAETIFPFYLNIDGHLYESGLNLAGNFRRGLANFYLKRYQFRFTKAYACKNYDII